MKPIIKILIVNGSPKGEYSLTLQHSLYMLGQEKDVEYKVLQASEALSKINFEQSWLESAITDIEWADAIIWNTPVYTMLVPWQLIRLFQLIKAEGRNSIFQGKYATSMMTCFHYYDHLAEDWLRSTSEDLGIDMECKQNQVSIGIADRSVKLTSQDSLDNYISMLTTIFPDNEGDINQIKEEIRKVIDLQSGEVVAKQEVFGMLDAGTPTAVDNSILVYGPDDDTNIVVVGNTFGLWAKGIYTDPETGDAETGGSLVDVSLIQNGNIALQPGMVRIDVTRKQNATKYEAKTVWSSDEMKNSSVARLAAPSGRLYLYNQDTETGIWQFEVLDIEDGKTLFTVPVGESPGNNNCGAIVQIDPDGNKVSVPAADKHLWSIQDDFIRIVGDEETVVNDVTRLLPDIDQQAVGYLTGCSFESATGEVEVEIEMADINADTSKLALYAQTASGDYQKLDQELWDITEGQISVLKLRMQDNVDWDINADQGAYHIALQFVYEP